MDEEKYTVREGIQKSVLDVIYKYKFNKQLSQEDIFLTIGFLDIFISTLYDISDQKFEEIINKIIKKNVLNKEICDVVVKKLDDIIKKVENETNSID